MTSSFLDRNVVIASVQTDGDYPSSYQNNSGEPEHRPNGGDLRAGDIWYDTASEVYYSYSGTEWVCIGGPGKLDSLEQRIAELEEAILNRS